MRLLLGVAGGSMAHFELQPSQVTKAVKHRSVEEVWYILSGKGEMWRKQGEHEEIVGLEAGVCLTIPLGTRFQFRAAPAQAVAVVAVTIPPWPGDDEAQFVAGPWTPT